MSFSERQIRTLIKTSVNPRLRIAKTAIKELNDFLSKNGAAIAKISSEIAGVANRTNILKEDIIAAYSALFL